jgi:hypothetical protein
MEVKLALTRGVSRSRRAAVLLAAMVATIALLGLASQASATTITNGTVTLGVNPQGDLNSSDSAGFFGVTYNATGNDGTRAGCPCEGWGAGAGGPTEFQARANENAGNDGYTPVSFTSTATSAVSVVDILRGGVAALRLTQDFHPSPTTPNLYEITTTLENISGGALTDVRYERVMDWDIEPTAFSEFVTINRGSTPPADLIYSDDNGFSDTYPFTTDPALDPSTVNTNYVDKGPADHGARFTFSFGALAATEKKQFFLYYGAAGNEADANAAVSAAALEVFSYGQPNVGDGDDPDDLADGPAQGKPNTFIWGFRAVGGTPVIPPTLTLSPKTATNTVGDSHKVTATLNDSDGNPVPGAKIVFVVSGTHSTTGSDTTDASGQADFSYTGTTAGDDTITACLDANNSGACEPGEVTDTAAKKWVGGPTGPRGRMVGEGRLTGGAKTLDYAYILDCTKANNNPPKFAGKLSGQSFSLTAVGTVACSDQPGITPAFPSAGFDTMDGTGTGKVGSTTVTVEWRFVDGGAASSGDTAHIVIRNAATSDVIFDGSGSPPGPYNGGTRTGRNTANAPS